MTKQIGFKLMAEAYEPKELVRQAVRAEEVGFDFVEISDHYHPWLYSDVRQAMLREALEVIRLLWQGGYQSHDGRYYSVSDARLFDLPDEPPLIAVASGGERASALAAELGDALFATDPDAELVDAYRAAGGSGPRYCEVPLAYAPDEERAVASAHEVFRFGALGWKVMSELPNPINFEAAAEHVTKDTMRDSFACGPDPARHLEVFREFEDAGFDRLALLSAGPDVDAFFDFFASELSDRMRGGA